MARAIINWEDINEAEAVSAYRVYVSTDPMSIETPPAYLVEVDPTTYSYELENLEYGKEYYVRISSVFNKLESFSQEMKVTIGHNVYVLSSSKYIDKYYEGQTFSKPGLSYNTFSPIAEIEVDHLGNLYAIGSRRVEKYDAKGNFLWRRSLSSWSEGIAVTLNGSVVIGNNETLEMLDPQGNYVWGVTPSQLAGRIIKRIVIDPQGVIIALGVSANTRYLVIYRYNQDGTEINNVQLSTSSYACKNLRLFTDPKGNSYVTYDLYNDLTYIRLDPFLNVTSEVNRTFSNGVRDSALDYEGNRIICTGYNTQPAMFNLNGSYLGVPVIGSFPLTVAIDEERNIYAADRNSTLRSYDKDFNLKYAMELDKAPDEGGLIVDPGKLAINLKLV